MEPILGVLLGGVLVFNAFVTPGRAEKEAEKALRKKFPGATVNVEIEGKRGRDVLKGRFKTVRVELSNLRIDELPIQVADPNAKSSSIGHLQLSLRNISFKDLPVKSAELSFDEVKYDFNALKKRSDVRLIAFSNGKIALSVEAPALLPLLAKRAPDIKNPQVELSGGEITLKGTKELFGVGANIVVKGPIVARGQNLELEGARVEAAGLNIAPIISAPIVKSFNPLYSFEGAWPFNVQIGRIAAENNVLEVEGTLTAK